MHVAFPTVSHVSLFLSTGSTQQLDAGIFFTGMHAQARPMAPARHCHACRHWSSSPSEALAGVGRLHNARQTGMDVGILIVWKDFSLWSKWQKDLVEMTERAMGVELLRTRFFWPSTIGHYGLCVKKKCTTTYRVLGWGGITSTLFPWMIYDLSLW